MSTIALALFMTTTAFATTHTVNQSGLSFVPSNLAVSVGDTVRWNWTAGVHTVTNGTGLGDPEVGQLFDDPLTSANPTAVFVFTQVGVVPYFCRPHLTLGMTGTVTVEAVSGVEDTASRQTPTLLQNVPNPFNPQTVIAFDLPAAAVVQLVVNDLSGRHVRTLLDGVALPAGPHDSLWNGRDDRGAPVAAGVYFYRLKTPSFHETRRMTLVK
jgi:plastocyanin